MDFILRCQCGQAIRVSNITRMGYYPRTLGPNRIHVKFICPECGHVQERMLRQYEWDQIVLYGMPYEETSIEERASFDSLGPITREERQLVRDTLAHSNPLEQLREWADRNQKS
jgi:hypothetical protein